MVGTYSFGRSCLVGIPLKLGRAEILRRLLSLLPPGLPRSPRSGSDSEIHRDSSFAALLFGHRPAGQLLGSMEQLEAIRSCLRDPESCEL